MTKHSVSKEEIQDELMQLAQLTPYLTYQSEFSLMFRLGSSKELFENFIEYMFSQFPHLK